jgi:hypothetical protein
MAKHIVSVGIGASARNARLTVELLGETVVIERLGTDGDLAKAEALLRELDGKVDAFGLGGMDLFVQIAGRRYYLRDAQRLRRAASKTPLVCGAGLKNTLERLVVRELDAELHWRSKRVLLVSALDRFGMAETLAELGADLILGDLIFILGVPLPLRSLAVLAGAARLIAPAIVQLPVSWLYPTGNKQMASASGWRKRYFDWAEIVAGDFHFIRRFAPDDLSGKTILTNTTTKDDLAWLRARGVRRLITTTPRYEGRSLSTNMLEAALVAVAGKFPLSADDYQALIRQSGLLPDVQLLSAT